MMEYAPMVDHIYASDWIDMRSDEISGQCRIVAHSGKHSMWHKIWSTHIEWDDGTLTDGNYDLTRDEALQDAYRRERAMLRALRYLQYGTERN